MERGAVIVARKVGQAVVIGEGDSRVVVEVLPPNGRGAKLRVSAPRDVRIRREDEPVRDDGRGVS